MILYDRTENEIISTNPKIQEDEIKLFENKINCQLPSEYRAFLLDKNGGHLKHQRFKVIEKCFPTPHPNGYIKYLEIENLYSLEKLNEALNEKESLIENITENFLPFDEFKNMINPEDVIIIGDAYFYLLLAVKGEFKDNIYQFSGDGLYFISNGIQKMLNACFTVNYDSVISLQNQIKASIKNSNFEEFKQIIEFGDGLELLSNDSGFIRNIAQILLRPNPDNGEQVIENYDIFIDFLEEKKVFTWDSLTTWLNIYDNMNKINS